MPRYKLTIAYDGTDFHGWQKQELDPQSPAIPSHGPMTIRDGRAILRTVQEVVEQAVRRVVREPIQVLGASRTDAGVHAWSQVAAFTSEPRPEAGVGWPADRGCDTLVRAVNSRLPDDVLVRGAEIVGDGFNPIGDCESKGYSYTYHVGDTRPLWDRRMVFHTWHDLDVERMRRATAGLVGTHDFAAFAALNHGRQTTVRTIHGCEVREERDEETKRRRDGVRATKDVQTDDTSSLRLSVSRSLPPTRIRLDICGDEFLYNMVRIIAGTLHEVGRGRIEPESIREILASGDRRRAGPTLPPEGLCLEWIRYPVSSDESAIAREVGR